MSRVDSGLIAMIDQVEKDLEELKTAQIFGSDSMNVNSWTKEVAQDNNSHRLTLAPSQGSLGVLPMEVSVQTEANIVYGFQPVMVYRFDGVFQWEIPSTGIDSVRIMLRWIGAGTVTWETI